MELLSSSQLKEGNCYQAYSKVKACNFIIKVKNNGELVHVDFSRVLGFEIKSSNNYYKYSPDSNFRFAIISEYSFNRMFNAVLNKLK